MREGERGVAAFMRRRVCF